MTLPANKILVVGGGFTGMSVAMSLTKIGAEVDLVEIDENWRAEGAGITVSGPLLGHLKRLDSMTLSRNRVHSIMVLKLLVLKGT